MASLFRPPESTRQNARSPRLKLPPLSNVSLAVPGESPTGKLSATSSRGSSATSANMKRPMPPPLPKLDVPLSAASSTEGLVRKMKQLSVEDESPQSGSSRGVERDDTTAVNQSVDSFFSNLISVYDQSSSAITSPKIDEPEDSAVKDALATRVPRSLTQGKDIDELSEEVWHSKNLLAEIETQGVLGEGAGGSVAKYGQVKLCDFGVSGEAVNSLATTFTGTSYYMAPERIQGQPYSVTCDVWSLGLTILEVAQGHFPFGPDKMATTIAPIELLTLILTFTPHLDDEPDKNIKWSRAFKSFIEYCLRKEARARPSPRQMIQHPWIQGQMKKQVDMRKFITKCWQK
ncbi:MAP kinase kinase MKK2/SSP33 [Nakaseomyces glabratus]|uniref:mitogen-activated protein kinase kinase n=1 Tax=Candida glabrata TaxID=5478 RepID=A0A0W0CCK8_CANGB|nr:MAP kinase kinase MKK2/SSP33 [Nakaseomyces glabratus]